MKTIYKFIVLLVLSGKIAGTAFAYENPVENGQLVVIEDNWVVSTNLYIGYLTSGNSMVVTNGGTVQNHHFGHLGYESGADSNTVVLTGVGSIWKCNGLRLGGDGLLE